MPSQPRNHVRLVVALVVVGAAGALASMSPQGLLIPNASVVAIIAVSILLGELYPVEIRRGNDRMLLMLSSTFTFALILYAGAFTAALVTSAMSLVADRIERLPWDRMVFNAGQYVLTVASAGAVLAVLGHTPGTLTAGPVSPGDLAALVPAALAWAATNHLLVSAVIALSTGTRLTNELTQDVAIFGLLMGLMLGFAPIVIVVASWAPLLLPIPVALAFAVHRGTRLSLEREFEAQHDRLTGLANRELFGRRLSDELVQAGRSRWPAVLHLDLDRFRDVNETLGHEAGDDLLRQVAGRLQECVGDEAVLSRLAADEFMVVERVSEPLAGAGLAATVVEALSKEFVVGDFRLHVRPRIGVAVYPAHGQDVETLLRHADVALQRAKDRHRDVEVYRATQDQYSGRRLRLVSDLQRAIEERQLLLHFQPQADLQTGRIVAAEALVRWDHPIHGAVSPAEFVPLAERSGLIVPMTALVLESALAGCARWNEAGFDLRVAVNVSTQDLTEADLPHVVLDTLERHGVAPQQLELEVTETSVMEEPEEAIAALATIRKLGVAIAIDDFGTGYSSLSYLQRLPMDTLKIDRSFVKRLDSKGGAAIVRMTVELANSLGVHVVAEGAESGRDWQALVELGCKLVQGYYLACPTDVDALLAWLVEHDEPGHGPARHPSFSPPPRSSGETVVRLPARPDAS